MGAASVTTGQTRISYGPIELRFGCWEDVLADVESVDAIVVDPPYGKSTHDGHNTIAKTELGDRESIAELRYDHWRESDVIAFINRWVPICRGWFVACTSHDLYPAYRKALEVHDRYVFAPLPLICKGMSVRMHGDGPSSWCVWLVVARPRTKEFSSWGTLPGAYWSKKPDSGVTGGKNLDVMRAILRDYTRHGDLVCDPCCGGGTTLIAAAMEGRSGIGAEVDPETYNKAKTKIGRGFTIDLFAG